MGKKQKMKGYIDIHIHILPGVDDDGPADLESSLELAEELIRQGFNSAVATPHCFEGNPSAYVVEDSLRLLGAELIRRDIPLELFSGAELALEPNLLDRIKKGEVPSLNKGPYLLVELPLFQDLPAYTGDLLFQMMAHGYRPVLAHPERISVFQKSLAPLYEFVERGIYTQLNLSSLTGLMGQRVQKTACSMVLHRLVHFAATDAHSAGRRLAQSGLAVRLLRKYLGPAAVEGLLRGNPGRLLRGEEVELPEPLPIRTGRFSRVKHRILSTRKWGMFSGR